MIIATALADRVFLEHAEARGRLARIEQPGRRRTQREDVLAGAGGHAAQALEKVQEDTFGREQVGGGAFDFGDDRPSGDELAVVSEGLRMAASAIGSEHHLEQAESGEDHRAAGDHAGTGPFGPGQERGGRITRAHRTLGEAEAGEIFLARKLGEAEQP